MRSGQRSSQRLGRDEGSVAPSARARAAGAAVPAPGFPNRPETGNRRPPVPVYQSGLAGYRSEPVEFKFEFKWRSLIS